jgi:serine/threonine-protein kinase
VVKPGDVIADRYRLEHVLGEGGMGEVWRATHLMVGNHVAIKLLKPEAGADSELATRFLREARSAGRLRGEHVCRVMDAGSTPTGQPYLAMELLEGEDIAQRLERGRLAPDEAARFIIEACEALAEAHALGMVHRDIKPANLFVAKHPGGSESIKVLDFGIATAAEADAEAPNGRLTGTAAVMGSPSYMSPEQMKSARDVDGRSDVWALGACLYEMISGQLPFEAPAFTALAIKIATEPHVPLAPGAAPAGLVTVVNRCLAKAPGDRFADVAELAAALAPWQGSDGATAAARVRRALAVPLAATMGIDGSAVLRAVATGPVAKLEATTLGLTASESVATPKKRGGGQLWIVAVAAVVMAIVIGGVLAKQGRGGGLPAAAPVVVPAPVPEPTVTPIPQAAVTPSPSPSPIPSPSPSPSPSPIPSAEPHPHPLPLPKKHLPAKVIKQPPPQPPPSPSPAATPCRPDDPSCGL